MGQTNNQDPAPTLVTVESLQGELATALQSLSDREATIVILQKEADEKSITIADLREQLTERDSLVNELNTQIVTLDTELDTLRANPPKAATFKLGDDSYTINAPQFKHVLNGEAQTITAEQLLKDKKLQAALVKKGVGFITKLAK